jgi:hypothetical protein
MIYFGGLVLGLLPRVIYTDDLLDTKIKKPDIEGKRLYHS